MKRSHSSITDIPSPLASTQLIPSLMPPTSSSPSSSTATATTTTKRTDHLSWDDYFMWNAQLASLRSKDPSTQVGACIVDADQRIVSIGYNGFPRDCSDDVLPWARASESGDPLETKYRESLYDIFDDAVLQRFIHTHNSPFSLLPTLTIIKNQPMSFMQKRMLS